MSTPEARGISRNFTEAENRVARPVIRIIPEETALELRVAAPDPSTWRVRGPAEAHGSPRKLKWRNPLSIRIFPGNLVLELRLVAPGPAHGETGSPWDLTELK